MAELTMWFALLLHEDNAERVAKSEEELGVCLAYQEAMRKAGILRGGARLRPADSAATVRRSDGRTQVVDGPYAEVKEQLGGFHLIEVPDLDTALAWAARCPSAERGAVEVRPLWPADA